MLMDEAPAAIAGVGVIVTGLLGYLTGKRRNSGSVATTDADKLWAQVDTHLKRLDRLIAEQGETISNLKFELHQKDEKIATLEASDVRKTAQIIDLQNELERVKDRERRVAETLADKEERAAG